MNNLDRSRCLPQPSATTKTSSVTSRPPQIVSQSQPGSRSTSPNSLRLSSTLRTPTNARSRIPNSSNNGSRISSRESSPGRTRMLLLFYLPLVIEVKEKIIYQLLRHFFSGVC
jgi:hypothetical protein